MQATQTGVFYTTPGAADALPKFPGEYRRRFLRDIDTRFAMIVAACFIVFGLPVFLLSFRVPSQDLNAKEIRKIQERYARLVLNQPKPQPVEEQRKSTGDDAQAKEKEKVDRSKESFAEKRERREQSREDRQRRREQISKEVGSTGIFAAITAAAGSGGAAGAGVSDLLGATGAIDGLAGLNVSRGTFATRNVDPATLSGRRGTRTEGVGIQVAEVGQAQTRQIASAGSVNVTSAPPQVSGDDAQVKSSFSCIQSVVRQESAKIKRVYETWLKREPQLSGKIKIKFTIMPGGTVTNVAVVQSSMNNGRFDENVTRYVQRWLFTDCSVDSALEIELPFVFEGMSQN